MGFIINLFAGPAIRYGLMIVAVFLIIYQQKCSIEQKAYKAAQNEITQKSIKVANERTKKARNARRRVHSKRVRKKRDPYRRD